jgi:hypothetical protein
LAIAAIALIIGDHSACATDLDANVEQAGFLRCGNRSSGRYAPCPPVRICPEPSTPAGPSETAEPGHRPGTQLPGEKSSDDTATGESAIPSSNALASNYGAPSGPLSSAPNMIGDQFGGAMGTSRIIRSFSFSNLRADFSPTPNFFTVTNDGTRVALNQDVVGNGSSSFPILNYNDTAGRLGGTPLTSVPAGGTLAGGTSTVSPNESFTSQFDVAYDVNIPTPGGMVGRMKIADDTSPMPRDRLIFDYNYFDGVPLAPGGVGVNRFTPGFEKTFLDGWMSFEMKCPMATTLDSTIVQDGVTNASNGEFGNVVLTWKTLLLLHEKWAISGGLSVAPPTADDVHVVAADGTPLAQVLNRSTHVGPFLGFLWTPNDRWFAQGFLQYDVPANGNPVFINPISTGAGLVSIGELFDTPFQYVDLGVGYWAYRGHDRTRRLSGWAFTSELHWNHSLRDTDVVEAGNWRIGNFASVVETLNLTLGTHIELFDMTTITFAYGVPIGGGTDREFNGEFRLMVNRRFGAQNRLTRAQF